MQPRKLRANSKRFPNQPNQRLDHEDHRSNLSFNAKILIFFAFTLIFRITILIRKRSAEDFAVVDEFAMIEIIAVGFTIVFLMLNANLKQTLERLSTSAASILLVYCGVSVISALWSPLSTYTLFRSIQVASQLLVIFVVIYECRSFLSAEQFVLRAASLLIIINIFGQLKLVKYNFSLGAMHSNTYTNSAAMLFCYCFLEYFSSTGDDRKRLRNYGLIGLFGIAIGTSATSNIAALISIFTARLIFYKRISIGALVLSAIIVIPVISFSQNLLNRAISDVILAGKDPHSVRTMSGRMHIWGTYVEVAKERPILGHGFAITTRMGVFRVNTAHNIVLAIALDLGIVGLCLFVWGGQRLMQESMRSGPQPTRGRLGVLGVFIAAFIACQSTPFIATHWHAPNAVFALFLALHTLHLRSSALAASPSSPPQQPRRARLARDFRSRRFRAPLSNSRTSHDNRLIR